jgi:hypothetical protein
LTSSKTREGATRASSRRPGRERHARANLEGVWNGRPISKIVLDEPLDVLDGTPVSRIELIPPVHQRVYRMGLDGRRRS